MPKRAEHMPLLGDDAKWKHWGSLRERAAVGDSPRGDHQILCFAPVSWNGQDPILNERLFGLTNSEGNHDDNGAGLVASHLTGWASKGKAS